MSTEDFIGNIIIMALLFFSGMYVGNAIAVRSWQQIHAMQQTIIESYKQRQTSIEEIKALVNTKENQP